MGIGDGGDGEWADGELIWMARGMWGWGMGNGRMGKGSLLIYVCLSG